MQAELRQDGRFWFNDQALPCVVGRGGVRADKREGDGATPVGLLPLRRVLYRADRLPRPRASVPVVPIAPQDAWCDDPGEKAYNRLITLPASARHELLWREDDLYDLVGVLGWNDAPVVPHRGSAIFLHMMRPDGAPTDGCIGLSPAELRSVLEAGLSGVLVRDPGVRDRG